MVRKKALHQLEGDIFKVMDLVFQARVAGSHLEGELRELAGVPEDTKKLTDEQRLSLLLVEALEQGPDVVDAAAKLVKLDVDALRKSAAAVRKADAKKAKVGKKAA